ncbi:hypothetical protein [Deinococcus enclensis]|uniref:NAD-dependent protein-ADP-ribosyltransferase YbiA (DUF1768 family) n=1 Tax=Deinococcus enclensis TaxID=1049582 RepID=A0ABT9MFN8_9DEIO|nr:hypothetical protein [Deinococcus enclensis]MDP9765405.1 putative NAD-dependent protein-ADP-ribosyltransferase YbiA (DUF1768 family) [Deinococcus enclensis]
MGFSEQDAPTHREEWGLNLLGHALMRARWTLQTTGQSPPNGA